MKIAILGAGGIGSTFAVQLARAGHEVSVIARNKRLAQLQERAGVSTASGEVVRVDVSAALDQTTPWDLVIVSVLAHQVEPVLPALQSSAAKRIMFMFNTFQPIQQLEAAVGPARFAFGFPAILANIDAQGVLHTSIVTRGMVTTLTDRAWAEVFSTAGIPSVVSTQMESWLRSHVAAVVPLMLGGATAYQRRAGVTWREARQLASAMDEGFELVRELGHRVVPAPVKLISQLPATVKAGLIWSATRVRDMQLSGAAAAHEASHLIDAMLAAAPRPLPELQRLRP